VAPQTIDQPAMIRIEDVRDEADEVCTLWLAHTLDFQPGQFVMIWIPRLDEKPYTISAVSDDRIALTVRRRGVFSSRLMEMQPGDHLGIRGPYGKGFEIRSPGVIVAGGCGLAPLAPLKDAAPEMPVIHGARTASELLFRERYPDMAICTDDGSEGHAGFPTDLLRPILEAKPIHTVYTCGPEVMMRAVFDLCEQFGVECQAGLERYMKCGFGICGQCTCDDRLVCQYGPVFNSDALRTMQEFGHTARLKSGKRVSLPEYANPKNCY